jgi:hypothetical protein
MPDPWILLPSPQQLTRLPGEFTARPDRFICLEGGAPGSLLPIGQIIQEALAGVAGRWELTTARGSGLDAVGLLARIDPAQVVRPEGYRLLIDPDRIYLCAHDAAGAFYGAMTLKQLRRQFPGAGHLPCVRIEDWPDFPNRGVMLDISRDRIPTMDTLYMLVDLLAEWKINQFQLYTEHTFAYRDHREVWAEASPMTGEQIMALDAYCRARFVELVPNQNSFGHMERWLKHPRYLHLAEAPDGFAFRGGWRDGPFGLSPLEPGSIELLAGMYQELLPHFSSRQVNVGCDETFDLGQGKSKAACAERGLGRVYLEFLIKIYELARSQGKTMQFWGDIAQNHPELIPELPKDVIALEWGYDGDHPFGERIQRLAEAGLPFYVCPSACSFMSIAGRTENALDNLRNAAEQGLTHGAIGYLNTDWGDMGHWQHLPVSFLGFAYGAAVCWAVDANREIDLPRALSVHCFQDEAQMMGRLAYDLGGAYKETGVLISYRSALAWLLLDLEQPIDDGLLKGLKPEALKRTLSYIDQVIAPLPEAKMSRPDADLIRDEWRNAAAFLRHACQLGLARFDAEGNAIARIPSDMRRRLAADLRTMMADYQRLWLARNRPGGLADSMSGMKKLLNFYETGS